MKRNKKFRENPTTKPKNKQTNWLRQNQRKVIERLC